MAKFDYFNSRSRKHYYTVKFFSGTVFTFFTFVNISIGLLAIYLSLQKVVKTVGLGEILLGLVLLFESYLLAKKYSEPALEISENSADRFSEELTELFEVAVKSATLEGISRITPEYVFSKTGSTDEGKMIFLRAGIIIAKDSKRGYGKEIPPFSNNFDELFSGNKKRIELEDFLLAASQNSKELQNFLSQYKISQKDFAELLRWHKSIRKKLHRPKFWQDETVFAGVGENWSYGYTPVLSLYSYDLSKFFEGSSKINVFSHQNKIDEIERVLAKNTKNNCLLLGEAGVGKKTIVNALAEKIARGDCLEPLKYKRIRQIDIGLLLTGTPAEIEEKIEGCLRDAASAGNIILFIENLQALLGGFAQGGQRAEAGFDASQILIPFLENSSLRIIAAVTPDDFYGHVRSNMAVASAFEKVEVNPATADDTIGIMFEALPYIETKYNVFATLQILKKIVELAERYIHEIPFPEKALRLLEETSVNYSGKEIKIISPEDIEKLVSSKVNVPIGEAKTEEKDKLLNLEKFLHQRVVGQEEAITAIADALRRVRAGLSSAKRPAGVFLFLGPTGVGKTETAKALAESYFGNEKNMIRLDMSEYQNPNSLDRLIGTVDNPNGVLNMAINDNPFSLVLLDELEKADQKILNMFLQVFEDGRLTDPRGRVCDFANAIIIATSNAGSEYIRESIGKIPSEKLKDDLINMLQEKGIFTPEFLNRFDSVIVYKPLATDELKEVAQLMIESINKGLEEKKIRIVVDDMALKKLVELGYDPEYGARPMRRVIQQKIENLLAKKMLSGEVGEDQTLNIGVEDIL